MRVEHTLKQCPSLSIFRIKSINRTELSTENHLRADKRICLNIGSAHVIDVLYIVEKQMAHCTISSDTSTYCNLLITFDYNTNHWCDVLRCSVVHVLGIFNSKLSSFKI